MKKITIFASGSGSNAENIVKYFEENNRVFVSSIKTNNSKAGVISRADRLNISCQIFNKKDLSDPIFINNLKTEADLIVLAGFLLKIPQELIDQFPEKIINIHPSLLPKYGGKGMYGNHVHQAVKDNNENKTGISVHLVNEKFDDGRLLLQKEVLLNGTENVEEIAQAVHELEYKYFPEAILNYIEKAF